MTSFLLTKKKFNLLIFILFNLIEDFPNKKRVKKIYFKNNEILENWVSKTKIFFIGESCYCIWKTGFQIFNLKNGFGNVNWG